MVKLLKFMKKTEKGQSLVEFALLLIFVLPPLLFGILQFGLIFNGQLTISHAVRDGARLAAVGKSDEDVKSMVLDCVASTPFLNVTSDSISITPGPSNRIVGEEIEVTVNASVDVIVPILDKMVGDVFPLVSTASMRLEVGQAASAINHGGILAALPGGDDGRHENPPGHMIEFDHGPAGKKG
ncbi:MAG: pilus assembly protein [Firmicutes bacterium]|nr:pilus assembly protein [Bacillota bacterium]